MTRKKSDTKQRRRLVAALLARSGRKCWLCALPMEPGAETIEHLKPLSLGGADDLKNLVLCHPGCNRQLGNRPAWQKIRMRDRRRRKRKAARLQECEFPEAYEDKGGVQDRTKGFEPRACGLDI